VAEGPIEIDGFSAVITLGLGSAMRVVAEHDAAAAGSLEPSFETFGLRVKDVATAQLIPQLRLSTVRQQIAHALVDRGHDVGLVRGDQVGVRVATAVLNQRAVGKPQQRWTLEQPALELDVAGQLVKVMALTADADPPSNA
jgi:hypothetical protein